MPLFGAKPAKKIHALLSRHQIFAAVAHADKMCTTSRESKNDWLEHSIGSSRLKQNKNICVAPDILRPIIFLGRM